MYERELRFITETSDELATVDPFYLPHIGLSIMAEHEARFIAVKDPGNQMKTIFVGYYNTEVESQELKDRYIYCFFDGSKNEHLKQYK